ncbi:sarcosine oxidase subunit alpha [Desulfacinum hydrothermale DSM 13146]|uniref:Sarcosine oxidase subunit alpha n=1 Tax=Desulfacinum hydrothermale DSM 13146 TaxID=1121390 RepID=A0A1W1XHQ5_9BACT|nr:2Fe-2S iron-sulfur cluster-binding protein [Desulfacinum hydrothermale]SMC23038.1 sarcosine oxidase subunit alpha [Desulfacinum hydrothermale DSM 13146]
MNRIAPSPAQRIHRRHRVSFTYGNRLLEGYRGDTVATALFANGVRIFSRSLKYHRPRGLYSLDGESSNCLMEIDGLPNMRAEQVPLRSGMQVRAQNVWGSPKRDLLGFLDAFHWAMPAGFYYRLFHKPYRLWPLFQNLIRRAAGAGTVNPDWVPGRTDELHLNADVCVVGGGPAGMHAAKAAAQSGLRVVVLEARPWLGGFYDWRTARYDQAPLFERSRSLARELEGLANVRIHTSCTATGLYGHNLVTAVQDGGPEDFFYQRYLEIRARAVVVATGCTERPLVFEHNERPGVMQPGCAHRLAHTYALLPGTSAVFSVGHDLGLEAAADLHDLGLQIVCVADCRPDGHDPQRVAALEERNIPLLKGWVAARALGRKGVEAAVLTTTDGNATRTVTCDLLAASAGLSPLTGLLSLARLPLAYHERTGFFLPTSMPEGLYAAGRLLGYDDPPAIELSGTAAGRSAAAQCGALDVGTAQEAHRQLKDRHRVMRGSKLVMAPGANAKSFVCFDEDVTVKHLRQAVSMGLDVPELAKRFTAAGTGPSQSGIPGHNLPLIMAHLRGESAGTLRPTTVRPPLKPTLLATYAGHPMDIHKKTPLHEVQERSGAVFHRVGVWKRARYFRDDPTGRDEILNVRRNVGIFDGSTLGKFRIFGPDAEKALQRVYVSDMSRVPAGKLKYSAMCTEDGCLLDDGVVTRVGENEYYFTTSTSRAGATVEWFRYHSRHEDWRYHLVNLTDALASINLAGPKAREVLARLTDADVSNEAFPFMGYRTFRLQGRVPARVLRLGFVGELSYEIHVPSSMAATVWQWLLEAGRPFGIRPFGLEAQNVLRLEKGHVIIGQESEIRTTLIDLGLGFLWDRTKTWAKTVGAPALQFAENQKGRLKLVGFQVDGTRPPLDGSIVVDGSIRGHVCTCRHSPTLEKPIGLALVHEDLAAAGSRLHLFEPGDPPEYFDAVVVPVPFYDPHGKRMKS